jgi:hypothetical protein
VITTVVNVVAGLEQRGVKVLGKVDAGAPSLMSDQPETIEIRAPRSCQP